VALDHPAEAEPLFAAGLELFQRLGHPRGTGWAQYNLAWLAAEHGRTDDAWRLTTDALTSFRGLRYEAGQFTCLVAAARLVVDDRPALAARWLAIAERVQAERGVPPVPVDRARADQIAQVARQHLGEAAFEAEWNATTQLSAAELESELDRLSAQPLSLIG
jgi:hypothetical protein